jgi:hypothetical protein
MLEPRRRRDFKDYVLRTDIDDPNLLRDGERLRVPMHMADGGEGPSVRLEDHQPGHVRPDAKGLAAKEAAYRQRAYDDANAWKTSPLRVEPMPDPQGSPDSGTLPYAARPFYAARVGDLCTVRGGADDGRPGHLALDAQGGLTCVADNPSNTDAASMPSILNDDRFIENDRQKTIDAYHQYDKEAADAWRSKG